MSDPEFLARVKDVADKEGWVDTQVLAEALGYDEDDVASVAIRCSWMKRYGVMERETRRRLSDGTKNERYSQWRLTEVGEAVINAKFSKSQFNALNTISQEQDWLLAQFFNERFTHTDPVVATLMRREAQVAFKGSGKNR